AAERTGVVVLLRDVQREPALERAERGQRPAAKQRAADTARQPRLAGPERQLGERRKDEPVWQVEQATGVLRVEVVAVLGQRAAIEPRPEVALAELVVLQPAPCVADTAADALRHSPVQLQNERVVHGTAGAHLPRDDVAELREGAQ